MVQTVTREGFGSASVHCVAQQRILRFEYRYKISHSPDPTVERAP